MLASEWSCSIKTRVDAVDPEILKLLWEAGVRQIKYGIEVPDEVSLGVMRKGIHVSQLEQTLGMTLEFGFRVAGVYILGWPGLESKDLKRHSDFINQWGKNENFMSMFAFVTPHPGTSLWKDSQSLGLKILTRDLSRYTHKQPVAVPQSLGTDSLRLIVDQYYALAESTRSTLYNPPLDPQYLAQIGYPISQLRRWPSAVSGTERRIGDCCM